MSNKIRTPNRVHGTIVPTPSGPMTMAHYVLAWCVKTLVVRTGGTFVIIVDDLLATLALTSAREPVGERAPDDLRPAVEYWTDELLMCLNHYDLGPSSEEELRAQGFNWPFPEERQMGVKWQSDSTITQHYYEIFGFEKDFGTWPLPFGKGQIADTESIYLATDLLGRGSAVHITHPWVVLSWAADEMSTGRNLAIDGEDLTTIVGQFGEHAHRLSRATGWQVPNHFAIPTIRGQALNGKVSPLSSSNCLGFEDQTTAYPQILISDAIEAGVDREGLDAYMFEHVISSEFLNPNSKTTHQECLRGETASPASFVKAIRSDAIIDEADWRRFLATGQLKPPKKTRGPVPRVPESHGPDEELGY